MEVAYSGKGRIAHLLCPTDAAASVQNVLAGALGLTPERAGELVKMGAVYLNKERLLEDASVPSGAYLRVHLQPRRYTTPEHIPVIHDEEDFVVVDKPAGLPVPPTVDNLHENLAAALERQLGRKLYVTHRLDTPTSGLCLLAGTPRFQSLFNRWLHARLIEKHYRALVRRPVPLGPIVHWQKPDRYAPKEVSATECAGWLRCELTVLACRPAGDNHELTLRLETGRTHQIRCQLAALGNPILGDTLYDGTGGAPEKIALQASSLSFPPPSPHTWHLPRGTEAMPREML